MGRGLLLALPVESVVLRALLAVAVAVVVARTVARVGLRSARARVAAAAAPPIALGLAALAALSDPALPAVMLPTSATGALLVPVGDGYRPFAPLAVTVVVLAWASVAALLVARRAWRTALQRRDSLAQAVAAPPRVLAVVGRVARALGIAPPLTLVAPTHRGGAAVIGIRRPVVVLDAALVAALDGHELEGVIAHELAHVARRDNLLALAISLVQDLAFFVPGSRWSSRLLHREREVAADQRAVAVTRRPAALASGLLKVLETDTGNLRACAALAPRSGLVDRIELLLTERPDERGRHAREVAAVVGVVALAVAAATVLPGALTSAYPQREAIGVMLASAGPPGLDVAVTSEARAFDVYRRSVPTLPASTSTVASRGLVASSSEDRIANLRACSDVDALCVAGGSHEGLGLRPQPVIVVDTATTARWQATPLVRAESGERFGVYWLARIRDLGSGSEALVASLAG